MKRMGAQHTHFQKEGEDLEGMDGMDEEWERMIASVSPAGY